MKITDEITVVIPHHNRHDLMALILKDITKFKVAIVKGGSFSENCNAGFKLVKTRAVVFLNDDTRIDDAEELFADMLLLLKTNQIVGCRVEQGLNGFNIINKKIVAVCNTKDKVELPSGHCLMMTAETFKKLKGFNEEYINGGEDLELFMQAMSLKMKLTASKKVIKHLEHQSDNRFDNEIKNVKLFNKRWGNVARALDEPTQKKEKWITL